MQTHPMGPRLGQGWLGLVAVLALAGCGGEASGSDPSDKGKTASQGAPGGTAAVMIDEPTPTTGGGGSSDGSQDNGPPPGDVGGSYPVGGSPSGPACPTSNLNASIDVTDSNGILKGTNGKVRVTVTQVDEDVDALTNLRSRAYVLRGPTQDWRVSATIPGLTSDLIQVGDELDFQLQTSPGFVPLIAVTNSAFGLFTPDGELLLFGARTFDNEPVPDLAFLGLQVTDEGSSCTSASSYAGGCSFAHHNARFSTAGAVLELEPGYSGPLGKLVVALQDFSTVIRDGSGCEDSGRSLVVGLKGATD